MGQIASRQSAVYSKVAPDRIISSVLLVGFGLASKVKVSEVVLT